MLPRLATKILRGHDDLLSVFRRKFAPVDSGMKLQEIPGTETAKRNPGILVVG